MKTGIFVALFSLCLFRAVPVAAQRSADSQAKSTTQENAVPEDGLVAQWNFEGGAARDLSGNGHEGRIEASPGLSVIDGCKALRFDGKKTRVVIPDHPQLHIRDEITIAARVMPFRTDKLHTILNKWYALDSYMLLIQNGQYVFSLAFPGGRWGKSVNVKAPARVAVWAEVVGTYDGRQMCLYVNGVRKASKVVGDGRRLQDSRRPLVIGHHPKWNAYTGLIDELRLYDRALSASGLKALFKSRSVGPPESFGEDRPKPAVSTKPSRQERIAPSLPVRLRPGSPPERFRPAPSTPPSRESWFGR